MVGGAEVDESAGIPPTKLNGENIFIKVEFYA